MIRLPTTAMLLALAVTVGVTRAQAAEPQGSGSNECPAPGGQGAPCTTDGDCANNGFATLCVEHLAGDETTRRCEIPCEAGEGVTVVRVPADCAAGETCVEGKAIPQRRAYFCRPTAFRVDLNLLDQCILSYLEGTQPVPSDNQCSLEANLTRLLDQNGDGTLDIFDVDLCVLAFLEQPGCVYDEGEGDWRCSADDLVPCGTDDDCGRALYCDTARHVCQRDCGVIVSREEGIAALERQCMGALKVCDYTRGRCMSVDPSDATCDVDTDCPSGAYCFLGRCAARCYRAVDCPSGEWYCDQTNRCRALPDPAAGEGPAFDPRNYAIRFAREGLRVDAVQTTDAAELVIMDIRTKRQVLADPRVTFGYRLEIAYALKEDTRCLQPFVQCEDAGSRPSGETEAECRARQDDCYIDESEEWLRLPAPFGTLSGARRQSLRVELETALAERLTPGIYPATIRAIFDNGDSATIPVELVKASPSGEYDGSLTVYMGAPENSLNGSRPLVLAMRIKVYEDDERRWHDLIEAENLSVDEDLVDLSRGQLVHATLHGSTALAFTRTAVTASADDEVPFVGLYSPDAGRMHLIGVIEVPADFCISEEGPCVPGDADQIQVRNPFGRTIRRQIELIGPFDEATARFHGLYRERISGLAADFDVTMEGGFILDQLMADDSPLPLDEPLLPDDARAVAFPDDAAVLASIDATIAASCGPAIDAEAPPDSAAWARAQFGSEPAFDAYLATARRSGPANDYSVQGRTTIFPALVEFDEAIEYALSTLGTDPTGQQDFLNVYEFLASRMLPCDPDDPSPPPACVDEAAARCGLALYRRALMLGWVDRDDLAGTGESDLYCPETLALADCPVAAEGNEALFALQDHNRFWWDLGQILKFEADRARSDAFLVLYRNEVNPFAQQAALAYKSARLRDAVRRYDELLAEIVAPAAAKDLFLWPARAFKQWGYDWLAVMHEVERDRMEALAELVDLEERIFMGTGDTEFVFAQHMMQHEYLAQVYLMALQAHWQRDGFGYLGYAGAVLQKGQNVLNQLDPARGPLGFVADRVYFENSDPRRYNWTSFRDVLVGEDGEGGLIGAARDTVGDAVGNLQGALRDLDTLQEKLTESRYALEDKLNEICGNPDEDLGTYCQRLVEGIGYDEWANLRNCFYPDQAVEPGVDCPEGLVYTCPSFSNALDGGNDCEMVLEAFTDNTDGTIPDGWQAIYGDSCMLPNNTEAQHIEVNGQPRTCIGGTMGGLLQEKAMLEMKRRMVLGNVYSLLADMQATIDYLDQKYGVMDKMRALNSSVRWAGFAIDSAIALVQGIDEVTDSLTQAPNCWLVVGFSFGTNCITNFTTEITKTTKKAVKVAVIKIIEWVKMALETARDEAQVEWDRDLDELQAGLEQRLQELDVYDQIDNYYVLDRELMNLQARIEDARYQAQAAADRFGQRVRFVAEHLVGRETGNLLAGDQLVQQASEAFLEVRLFVYKMTLAFIHHYNVPPVEARSLVNASLAIVTLDDAAGIVAALEARARDYCGLEAIDCDAATNVEVLRFSVREQLFPHLRDVVDARTGAVVTAGEQFHNLVTQAPYLKRRVRGNYLADQIELVLPLPVTLQENGADGPKWLIDPLTCNHLLDARDPSSPTGQGSYGTGTVAVNVVVHNPGGDDRRVRYELVRGAVDLVRSCDPESVVQETGTLPVLEYPIRKHVVGYAPQSTEAQEGETQSFVTRSAAFTACMNQEETSGDLVDASCWRFFARDRSLAALDWKIVVPIRVAGAATDNTWLLGEGLPDEERPILEDIVVYFRYRTRPVQEY